MDPTLSDAAWDVLIRRIRSGRCTPFLGAGASHPALPLASEIARRWAREYSYPLNNPGDLTQVAQFLAIQYDPLFPKEKILQEFQNVSPPDFRARDEPHAVLADLPLPVYMTTNYDDFMVRALKSLRSPKDPRQELCRWHDALANHTSVFDSPYEPSPANPVVFHLHGHTDPESLVLTEDDYLIFLSNIARHPELLPVRIQIALDRSTCLFLVYRLADWNFRVLFQGLRPNLKTMSVAVLTPPGSSEAARLEQAYMDRYYASMNLQVYWGTATAFCSELRERLG
jgi:hypothetical protein